MAKELKKFVFDPSKFEKELEAFGALLDSKPGLSEREDVQPFFERNEHLAAYLGTLSFNVGPATELAFQYPVLGDFSADVLLGNKSAEEFCVVEFEDGRRDSIFKKGVRANPEWGARFEHGFNQIVDWFYNLDDFKGTKGFAKTFGYGHVKFIGVLVIGRSVGLDETKRSRLKWRTERVLIDSHPVHCITFDDLHALLRNHYFLYRAASKLEKKKRK